MIVSLNIDNYDVHRILVDHENLVNVLFYNAFSKKDIPPEQLRRLDSPLVGFIDDTIPIKGVTILSIIIGRAPR